MFAFFMRLVAKANILRAFQFPQQADGHVSDGGRGAVFFRFAPRIEMVD